MNEFVRVRRWGRNISLSVPVEFKDLFKDTDRAIVEQKGNALIYITIDGNSQGNIDVPFGQGYYGLFLFRNCENVVFDGVTLEYAKSDGIIFRNGDGITVTNCIINKMGHEGLYSLYSDNVEFTNNDVFTRINSACRIASGNHVLISNNEIYSSTIKAADGGGPSTGPGIEINIDNGQPATDIEISKNYIHDLRGSGI